MKQVVYTGIFTVAVVGQHEFPRGVPIPVGKKLADRLLLSPEFEEYAPSVHSPTVTPEPVYTPPAPEPQPWAPEEELLEVDELDGLLIDDDEPLYD